MYVKPKKTHKQKDHSTIKSLAKKYRLPTGIIILFQSNNKAAPTNMSRTQKSLYTNNNHNQEQVENSIDHSKKTKSMQTLIFFLLRLITFLPSLTHQMEKQ